MKLYLSSQPAKKGKKRAIDVLYLYVFGFDFQLEYFLLSAFVCFCLFFACLARLNQLF